MSELTVKNCHSGEYFIDSRLDATEVFLIDRWSDSLTITTLQLVPDSSMSGLIAVPLFYRTVMVSPCGDPAFGKPHFTFTIPRLSDYQKRLLKTLCSTLKSGITKPISNYPFDEMSVYLLFLGALTECDQCYDLFVNLDNYYIIDGAVSETKAEMPFEYILNNPRRQNN